MDNNKIQLFESKRIRSVWVESEEEWYFSVVDVVAVLTEQATPRSASNYWAKLKERLIEEGSQLLTNCQQLKMTATDGKERLTDVATTEQLFRLIQSIPSPKAEPFKLWLAKIGKERLEQAQDPEKSIKQAMQDYKKLGYSDNWINQRIKSMEIRKELTDEWKNKGLKEETHFATLTDIITKTWSGKTTREYKRFKNLKKENLRDNMTNTELVLNMLAELSTKNISETSNPASLEGHKAIAKRGGNIAKEAREKLEKETSKKVISSLNAKTGILLKGKG